MKCPCPCISPPPSLPLADIYSGEVPAASAATISAPSATQWTGIAPGPCFGNPTLSRPFDYAAFRYKWDELGGEDLDTRTQVIIPLVNYEVGWARDAVSPNPNGYILEACEPNGYGIDPSEAYLLHGGDNCDFGVETILINFQKLMEDFPDATQFIIRMRAFWYDVLASGDFSLEFETYLGGSMIHEEYDFVNSGGVAQQTLLVPRNVQLNESSDLDGEDVAQLIFNVSTKTAVIVDV